MPQAQTIPKRLDSLELDHAFDALKAYQAGSDRGALVPLDKAVVAALNAAAVRESLERKFLALLKSGLSLAAVEYVCSKLSLIGSNASVLPLAELLSSPQTSQAARNVLEKIFSKSAARALMEKIPKLDGSALIGAIQSLGKFRDAAAVAVYRKLLRHNNAEVAAAAAYALGETGSPAAAETLQEFLPHAPAALRVRVADAGLVCAERLLNTGHQTKARQLYSSVSTGPYPVHVREAAQKGLKRC